MPCSVFFRFTNIATWSPPVSLCCGGNVGPTILHMILVSGFTDSPQRTCSTRSARLVSRHAPLSWSNNSAELLTAFVESLHLSSSVNALLTSSPEPRCTSRTVVFISRKTPSWNSSAEVIPSFASRMRYKSSISPTKSIEIISQWQILQMWHSVFQLLSTLETWDI